MGSRPRGCFPPPSGGPDFDFDFDSDSKKKKSQRQRSTFVFFGNSTVKRISVLFALLNIFALLKYWNLMNKTQLAMMKRDNNNLEQMMGGYQFHALETDSQRHRLPIEADVMSPDKGSGATPLDIPTNTSTTKAGNNIRLRTTTQRRNESNDSRTQGTTLASDSASDRKTNSGKFAYAFLIGGAMSEKKGTDYRGGLFGVVVAAHSLRRQGSSADIVLMVQISATSNATSLPVLEETLLQAMNIRLVYLPKVSHYKLESFYSLMMEKFRVLQLEEYSRVLYLDADILPICNLDYMMELSEDGALLRENVVLAYKGEPASGGLFILKPNATDYGELVDIIEKTERKYYEQEYPHWDPVKVSCGHNSDRIPASFESVFHFCRSLFSIVFIGMGACYRRGRCMESNKMEKWN